jgi:hypothetical protein
MRRWEIADSIIKNGLFFDHASLGLRGQWPIFPSILNALLKSLTGETGIYALFQVLALIYLSWRLLDITTPRVSEKLKYGIFFLYCLSPIVWTYAVFHSIDSLVAVLLLSFILLISHWHFNCQSLTTPVDLKRERLFFYLILALIFIACSSRPNCIIIPLITAILLFFAKYDFHFKMLRLTSIVLVTFVGIKFTALFSLLPIHSSGLALALRNAAIVANLKPKNHFNQEFKTFLVRKEWKMNKRAYRGIWWGGFFRALDVWKAESADGARQLRELYIRLALAHPDLFFRENMIFLGRILGLSARLDNLEIGRFDLINTNEQFKYYVTERQHKLLRLYTSFIEYTGDYFLRPIVVFLIFILLITPLVWRKIISKTPSTFSEIVIFIGGLTAFFYYATFMLLSPTHELRYFFPTLTILSLLNMALFANRFVKPISS